MALPVVIHVASGAIPTARETLEVIDDLLVIHAACVEVVTGSPHYTEFDVYLTDVQIGSVWLELVTHPDTPEALQVAGLFVAAITSAPWLAAVPHKVRERWYRSARQAELAKQAYERLRLKGELAAQQGSLHDAQGRPRRQQRQSGRRTRGTT